MSGSYTEIPEQERVPSVLGEDWVFVTEGLPGWIQFDPHVRLAKFLVLLSDGEYEFATYDVTSGWCVLNSYEYRPRPRVIAWRCIPVPTRGTPEVLQKLAVRPEKGGE